MNHPADQFVGMCLRPAGREIWTPRADPPLTHAERNLYGMGFAPAAAPVIAAAGPAAPVVAAGVAIATAIAALASKFGPDPRNVPDTQNLESAQIALNKLWYEVSGEELPYNCTPGLCGKQGVMIFAVSQYPNVPYGAAGNPAVNIDNAIQQAEGIISYAYSLMQKPDSRNSPMFSGGGTRHVELLRKVKAARAGGVTTKTASLSTGVTAPVTMQGLLYSPWTWLAVAGGAYLIWGRN